MRSFAAALLAFAVITECFAAQSERSRQRSGHIRSVPVAADVKRDNDFDCPEEFGYYPHPTDCTLYYVCVFGGALLESCTGGLMYSHELQTCDWPRNVGCDSASVSGHSEDRDLERISEREPPPPPPPPRRAPPPPPRAQPNPVITSRGQPKFNRDEYEKQQQLYAEVDDLPPVEEIESDRQQRVNRGQPPTIGQVQKDRDGYSSQVVNSRTLNSNIIPASITQNSGKIGSFSFGTQVDDRRTATATQAPLTYSEDQSDNVTDHSFDRQIDIETNVINVHDVTEKPKLRLKRDVEKKENLEKTNSTATDKMSDRSDKDEIMEYIELENVNDEEDDFESGNLDDIERGKRQIRYYQKNYKSPGKIWSNSKPAKYVELQQYNSYNPNAQNPRYPASYSVINNNNYNDGTRKPYAADSNLYSSANPFASYQLENAQSQRPFVPSLRDPFDQRAHHPPMNVATQIITKSPPISALSNNENPFAALAGGFYNNKPVKHTDNSQHSHSSNNQFIVPRLPPQQTSQVIFPDSSLLPSTVVTGKPVQIMTSPRTPSKHNSVSSTSQPPKNYNKPTQNVRISPTQAYNKPSNNDEDYSDEDEDDEDDEQSSEEDDGDNDKDNYFKPDFPEPPYEYTHPSHKYAEIENPFANPNFDFDAFISKLKFDPDKPVDVTTPKPNVIPQNVAVKIINPSDESTSSYKASGIQSSTLNYDGMSTPRPFSSPSGPESLSNPEQTLNVQLKHTEKSQKLIQPSTSNQNHRYQQHQYGNSNNNAPQQNAGLPLGAVLPRLKPPNFKDDRQLPITYSFSRPLVSSTQKTKEDTKIFTVTQKPYLFYSSTGSPIILSTPKQQFLVKPDKIVSLQPPLFATGKPYLVSSIKPHNVYTAIKYSTPKPLTTLANEQLSALQQYWRPPSTEPHFYVQSTGKPTIPNLPKLHSLFAQAIKSSTQSPLHTPNIFYNTPKETKSSTTTTTKAPPKRRPIPKPSPEMNDYYYEDEEELYEPPVKSKYMPSTEVKPQRPKMAQNYQEYEDFEDSEESPVNNKPLRTSYRRPITKPHSETATKNHNDVSVVTKAPVKHNKYINGKIPIPVLVEYETPVSHVLVRPEVSNYEIVHHIPRNRTVHTRRPTSEVGPYTAKPPKYLNQTTLRPYTVRHRLAKPTTERVLLHTTPGIDNKQVRGRMRHHNLVAQMKLTTPRDNHNQETRFTKTKHDDKTNSLEPTESVTASYNPSPRPKMLYNGTQNYSPDQYDPFYAVYDEDGELYKDTDYVQQYNTASLRPAVQQTYRGTPPPARRPVDTYTPRPTQEDYDDALIRGQINNQNQYQSGIRHSTRGEGNELGYDHIPSSVKTTVYEATSISTTPSTTSTSTTTQRPTTAPFTEAMTPSRYTPRSSTDENPNRIPQSLPQSPSDGPANSIPSTHSPVINFSSLAKPFERTDNSHRLKETITSTEKVQTIKSPPASVTNNNKQEFVEVVHPRTNKNEKSVVSLTSGFSIRRNPNNSNNPYTLTVLTRPFDTYSKTQKNNDFVSNKYEKTLPFASSKPNLEEPVEPNSELDYNVSAESSDSSMRRKDVSPEVVSEEEPIYVRPSVIKSPPKFRIKTPPTSTTTSSTKYYLKTVIKRPAPFGANNNGQSSDSRENAVNTDALIEAGLQNARGSAQSNSQISNTDNNEYSEREEFDQSQEIIDKPLVSRYKTLNNLQNNYEKPSLVQNPIPSTTPRGSTTTVKYFPKQNTKLEPIIPSNPSYYSYRVADEDIPDQTTEVFSGSVKNIIKAFFNNFDSTPKQISTPKAVLPTEEKTVNIGFQQKPLKFVDNKPYRNPAKRIQIVTEPTLNRFVPPYVDNLPHTERNNDGFSSTSTTMATTASVISNSPFLYAYPETTPHIPETSPYNDHLTLPKETYLSRFSDLMTEKPEINVDNSYKFLKIVTDKPTAEPSLFVTKPLNNYENDVTKPTRTNNIYPTDVEWDLPTDKITNEFATTTSTTKSTTTVKITPTTPTTKSLSFPTRASRVNPAIKLAATNPGGGRRSYQSSSKCSSDNSLQANPKCNEIKYQRPSTSTRGRGSAHYSTLDGSERQQQQPANRGTPPTRSRPTLKPSTAVVTNTNPFVDIYTYPPRRPSAVYPQPTPDKTAAKCRKDVCLLPDCYCGGKDIPGDLPVETVPQIVLLTFDDSVNDLNKGLYADLFEKGRVNPNGCPISSTFYVSHEWTDYSQVQNLYAGGHEMASHTISHSFGEQFSQKKWNREVSGQREILSAYGGVKLEDVRGMRAPFLSVGGNKMFKMLYDSNFTYDSSMPVYENRPPSWPYTLDYKLFHDCMIPPCPTKSYPGVWEVPMVMWQDLNGGRCSMGDACANPPEAEGVYKMLLKNFDRHYTTNRAPFGLYYHAAWFTQPHHKAGFIMFLDFINQMSDVWIVTNWQALQWVRDPTPISRLNNFQPFQCNYQDRPRKCNNPKVCNLWHKSGVRYMRTCQPCPEVYPWTGKSGIKSSRIDNDIDE